MAGSRRPRGGRPGPAPRARALLRRFVRWQEGAPFDASLLLGTQFALDDSLYFSTVEVLPGERDRATLSVPVVVQLVPGKRQRYAAAVGYATTRAVAPSSRGTIDV